MQRMRRVTQSTEFPAAVSKRGRRGVERAEGNVRYMRRETETSKLGAATNSSMSVGLIKEPEQRRVRWSEKEEKLASRGERKES